MQSPERQEKLHDEMQFTAGASSKPTYAYQKQEAISNMHQHADHHHHNWE